jgi:hypothetical protein
MNTDKRPDDPAGVMAHYNKYAGGRCLIVLGGYSGAAWRDLHAAYQPDVVIGVNGTNASDDLRSVMDYWICTESMSIWDKLATVKGDQRAADLMKMMYRTGKYTRLISHRSWHLIPDKTNAISVRRTGYEIEDIPSDFTFRDYGEGFLGGWVLKHAEAGSPVRVGTVGLHALHMAGILGCSQVATIGFDLMFRDTERHHWYDQPIYQPDRFRKPEMFTEYKGIATQWFWVETADYLKQIYPRLQVDGIEWIDYSEGLLKVKGVAQPADPFAGVHSLTWDR